MFNKIYIPNEWNVQHIMIIKLFKYVIIYIVLINLENAVIYLIGSNENGRATFYATDHFLDLITSLNNLNQESGRILHLGNNTSFDIIYFINYNYI